MDFISLIENISGKCDLMVEVGSGRVLSGLVNSITNSCECFPLESKPQRDLDLNNFLAHYFVSGGDIKWEALYENRLVRDFIPASEKKFIENPCERPLPVFNSENTALNHVAVSINNLEGMASHSQLQQNLSTDQQLEILLSNYFSERSEFLAELIKADLNSLPLF